MTLADEATAYHEAGHYVMGYVLGGTLGVVNISPDGAVGGVAEVGGLRGVNLALVVLAGREAHLLWAQGEPWRAGTKPDEVAAADLEKLRAVKPDAVAKLRSVARAILARYWGAVEALAGALVRRQALTPDEGLALLRCSLGGCNGPSPDRT